MSILEKLIIEDFGLIGSGKWYHSEAHSSLIYNAEKDIFWWNSKDISGNAYIYLTKVRGYSHTQAVEYLKQTKEYDDTFIHRIKNDQDFIVYPKLIEIFHQRGLEENESYWFDRGINIETINRFSLGFTGSYFTIPIFVDGIFRNFQLRKDNPKTIRYYYPEHTAYLFNVDILKLTKEIIITEGLTDCLRLLQEGIPCVACPSAGSWQQEWFKYFIYQKKINIIFDFDTAGISGARKISKFLGMNKCRIYNFEGKEKGYDITDYLNEGHTGQDLKNLIETNSKYSFE